MNEKKQLDCHLYCRATASVEESVAEDLLKDDKGIKELLDEQQKTENNKECHS